MVENNTALNKYKITAIILLAVSVVLNILQKPIFNHLVLTGQESILNGSFLTIQELNGLATLKPLPIFTFPLFLFIIEVLLFGAYIIFQNNKVISKFLSIALAVDIASRIYSMIGLIKLIVAYSNYNSDMEWVKPIITQYTTNALITTAYLIVYAFLLIDSLKKHKFLKIARIVMLFIAALGILPVIMNFFNNNLLYAIISSYGFLIIIAFLIYYFRIAENKNKLSLESELHRLKTEYESGNITDEEYTNAKQNILKSL